MNQNIDFTLKFKLNQTFIKKSATEFVQKSNFPQKKLENRDFVKLLLIPQISKIMFLLFACHSRIKKYTKTFTCLELVMSVPS